MGGKEILEKLSDIPLRFAENTCTHILSLVFAHKWNEVSLPFFLYKKDHQGMKAPPLVAISSAV